MQASIELHNKAYEQSQLCRDLKRDIEFLEFRLSKVSSGIRVNNEVVESVSRALESKRIELQMNEQLKKELWSSFE